MASWKESMGRMAQTAVAKSKEMAEVTRLNLEISNLEQQIKEIYLQAGEYLLTRPELLPVGDETVSQQLESLSALGEKLEQSRQSLLDVRNLNICPSCGAEVSRVSKFCDRCGAAMDRSILEQVPSAAPVCPGCGAPVDKGAVFCGNCGTKLDQ